MRKAIAYLQQRTLPRSVTKSIPDGLDITVVIRGKNDQPRAGRVSAYQSLIFGPIHCPLNPYRSEM
jgi:hypothetical protein